MINVYYNKKTVGIATYGFKINDLGLLNCPTINLYQRRNRVLTWLVINKDDVRDAQGITVEGKNTHRFK